MNISKSSTYACWKSMKQRCLNPNHPRWKDWGGRGITICSRWLTSFNNFLEDMGEKPKGYSLDRIDNNKGYEPLNCQWSSALQQSKNRRNSNPLQSTLKGIHWHKRDKRWLVEYNKSSIRIHLGSYKTLDEAEQALLNYLNSR